MMLNNKIIPFQNFQFTYDMNFKVKIPVPERFKYNNLSQSQESLEEIIKPFSLKQAVDYGFKHIKRINNECFKEYEANGSQGLNEFSVFNSLNINLSKEKGFAHEVKQRVYLIKWSLKKQDYKMVKNRFTQRLEEYKSIIVDAINDFNTSSARFLQTDHNLPVLHPGGVEDMRNFLIPSKPLFEVNNNFNMSDEVFNKEFRNDLIYACNRQFDSGLSAIIAKEWCVNFLNKISY